MAIRLFYFARAPWHPFYYYKRPRLLRRMCHHLRLPFHETLHFDNGLNMPPSCCKLDYASNVPECARMCHECASECAKFALAAIVRSACAGMRACCCYNVLRLFSAHALPSRALMSAAGRPDGVLARQGDPGSDCNGHRPVCNVCGVCVVYGVWFYMLHRQSSRPECALEKRCYYIRRPCRAGV